MTRIPRSPIALSGNKRKLSGAPVKPRIDVLLNRYRTGTLTISLLSSCFPTSFLSLMLLAIDLLARWLLPVPKFGAQIPTTAAHEHATYMHPTILMVHASYRPERFHGLGYSFHTPLRHATGVHVSATALLLQQFALDPTIGCPLQCHICSQHLTADYRQTIVGHHCTALPCDCNLLTSTTSNTASYHTVSHAEFGVPLHPRNLGRLSVQFSSSNQIGHRAIDGQPCYVLNAPTQPNNASFASRCSCSTRRCYHPPYSTPSLPARYPRDLVRSKFSLILSAKSALWPSISAFGFSDEHLRNGGISKRFPALA